MPRITREYLRSRVHYLQQQGIDVAINWLNGSARITNCAESHDISSRIRNTEMAEWLDGFIKGIDAGNERISKQLQPLRERLEAWRDNAALMQRQAFNNCHGADHKRWKNERINYQNLIDILDKL